MTTGFRYTARRYDGQAVSGVVHVDSRERAAAHLIGRALFVTSLARADEPRALLAALVSRMHADRGARVAFMRSMATLVSAGVPLRRALDIATEQCADAQFQEALRSIRADLDGGVPLWECVARRRELPPIAAAVIRAGERAGALDEAFEHLATWTERERAVQNRLASALAYPVFVSVAAAAVLWLLIAQTAPAFAAMFAQMNVPLPASTRALLWAGHLAGSPRAWCAAAAVLSACVAAAFAAGRSRSVATAWRRSELRVPVYGTLVRKRALSRLSRALSMLLKCGVEVLPALTICEDVVRHDAYRSALAEIRAGLGEGQPISDRLAGGLFDAMFVNLVRVGEETGRLDVLLSRLAGFYEDDLDATIQALTNLVEPALILLLGTAVGAIAAAILVPFYSLVGSLR